MNTQFNNDIKKFNDMYGLPYSNHPTTALEPVQHRMKLFKKIISDEVSEVDDIIAYGDRDELDDLVSIADWLGDLIVYCSSEAKRYGLPMDEVLAIIMESNFSKLDENGEAIIEEGKVQKGKSYFKPEPKIRELLKARMLPKHDMVLG
jgi:predicted HAD superfamily Cof-like phosphohydrolase